MAGKKILAIDDNVDILKCLRLGLEKQGYQTILANNGEEGLKFAELEKPDLILLDIKMPQMDGYTFVRELKKNPTLKNIPVIVLTGYEPMRDMFQFEGVNGYFLKTDDLKILFEMVEKTLNP